MKIGEVLELQYGEGTITFRIREFTQDELIQKSGKGIKVSVLVEAPKSCNIIHLDKNGTPLKGKKSNANNQRSNQEKEDFAIKAIKGHNEDTRAERSEGCLP